MIDELRATCLNTKEWYALFACLTRVKGRYYKGAIYKSTFIVTRQQYLSKFVVQ